jgi:hypothetical protein
MQDGPLTGFGAVALDVDNDGLLDVFAANGHVDDRPWINHPMAQLPHLYRARGPGKYDLVGPSVAPYFAGTAVGRGVAAGDLDNDGRVDLSRRSSHSARSPAAKHDPGGHWLGLRLISTRSGKTWVPASLPAGGRRRRAAG